MTGFRLGQSGSRREGAGGVEKKGEPVRPVGVHEDWPDKRFAYG